MTDKRVVGYANRIVGHGEAPASSFIPNEANWRIHPRSQQDALDGTLKAVGWVSEVIINRRTSDLWGALQGVETLVDGHMRVLLAMQRGQLRYDTPVPITYVDLNPQEEALILATFDPISSLAVADREKLDELLRSVQTGEAGVQSMLAELAKDAGLDYGAQEQGDAEPQVDRAAELQVLWQTAPGQLWRIGEHRLLVGDSTKREGVKRVMGGEKAVCMWTDPPYGVNYVGKTKDALTIENDGALDLPGLLAGAFGNAQGVALEPGSPFYVAHPPGALQVVFLSAVVALGWQIHEQLVWVKDSMVLGHSDYHYKHEPILYGYVPGPGRSGRGDHAGSRWYGDNSQVSVFEIPRPKRSEEHPTMKPPELVGACLSNSTQVGGIVYEPFAGSGSTGIACENLHRRARMIEIDQNYAAVILQRMADAFGITGELIEALP